MKTIHPIELLQNRFSPRAFRDEAIQPEILESLFTAAGISPSAFNEQPWLFFAATKDNPEEYNKIVSILFEGNQAWATQAPALLFVAARTTFTLNGKSNPYAAYDTGGAIAHLTTQAASQNIYVHQMAGFDKTKAVELFGLTESMIPLTVIALGYLPESMDTAEAKQEIVSKRTSKPLSEIVFSGKTELPFNFKVQYDYDTKK